MDLRHAVDIAGDIHGKIRHMGGIVLYNKQVRMLAPELGIDPQNDIADLRHHAPQQVHVPLLQCLAHYRVVRIREGLLGDLEALLKGHALQHQQPDQLGDGHCGVGVVQLHGVKLRKAAEIIPMGFLIIADDILKGSRGQHILLLDPQVLALPGGIVGIQDPGNILRLILVIQGLLVILGVEGIKVQLLLGLALP